MAPIQRIRLQGLISSPAFSHVAIVPPGATTIYVGGQNAVDGVDLVAGYGAIASELASDVKRGRRGAAMKVLATPECRGR